MAEAYLNGSFVPLARAALPLNDEGFLQGAIVTDNCRTWNGKLFRWADHLQRFRRDCTSCHIPLRWTNEKITAIARELLLTATEDVHLITFASPNSFGMYTRPVDHARNERFFREGVRLRVVGHQPVACDAVLPPRAKHRSRMVWHVARHRAGEDVAVLLDRPGGTLTETAIAAVLVVIDGVLMTPPRGLILDSISLRVALELADSLGYPAGEGEIRRDDWLQADEILLAGTGFGIAGVCKIDDHSLRWPGPITQALMAAWRRATESQRAIEPSRSG